MCFYVLLNCAVDRTLSVYDSEFLFFYAICFIFCLSDGATKTLSMIVLIKINLAGSSVTKDKQKNVYYTFRNKNKFTFETINNFGLLFALLLYISRSQNNRLKWMNTYKQLFLSTTRFQYLGSFIYFIVFSSIKS